MAASIDRGFSAAFVPLKDPVAGTDSVGTASKLLFTDHPGNMPHNVRRVRIVNTHATKVLGLYLADLGAAATGGVFANSIQILPGREWAYSVDAEHRLLIIGDSAGCTYNFFVDDI